MHSKSYKSKEEYFFRRGIFERSMRFVTHHNSQPDVSSEVGINFFSDLSRDEIKQYFLGDSGAPERVSNDT